METTVNITRNCTYNHISNNESLAKLDIIYDNTNGLEHPVNICKSLAGERRNVSIDGGNIEDGTVELMEKVFEVGLLTIVGVAGVIGNVAAIILFTRYLYHCSNIS